MIPDLEFLRRKFNLSQYAWELKYPDPERVVIPPYRRPGKAALGMRWIPTECMLADGLTKRMTAKWFDQALHGEVQLMPLQTKRDLKRLNEQMRNFGVHGVPGETTARQHISSLDAAEEALLIF